MTTFRLMLALLRVLKLKIHQLDVDSVFLYADLDEEVIMTPPPDQGGILFEVGKESLWAQASAA